VPSVAPRCRQSSDISIRIAILGRAGSEKSTRISLSDCSIDPMPGHNRGTLVQDQGSDELAGLPDLPPATV
jgi:hypothetical protein